MDRSGDQIGNHHCNLHDLQSQDHHDVHPDGKHIYIGSSTKSTKGANVGYMHVINRDNMKIVSTIKTAIAKPLFGIKVVRALPNPVFIVLTIFMLSLLMTCIYPTLALRLVLSS
jgi:hypothetical protein